MYYYNYDTSGNITKIQEKVNGVYNTLQEYQYDQFNQMVYARDYENDTLNTYTYDEGGNILSESIQSNFDSIGRPQISETIDYAYTDINWKDKMTEYNGQTITYDRIGNPLTYRDGMTMTWKRGRQLTTLQTAENSIQYKYDSDSIRTSKIVDGVVHTYEYLDGLLMHETRGTQAYDYYYDVNGQLYAVSYKLSENDTKKVYYFTHNWRGDIVGIYNGNGDLKATYSYDAWGNVTAIKDASGNAITSATHIANLNPFRYRGYYMDTETGLYYLLSRYYDPVTHRFLNADGYFQAGGSLLDTNMNAYCGNNPVNRIDYNGEGWIAALVVVAAVAIVTVGVVTWYCATRLKPAERDAVKKDPIGACKAYRAKKIAEKYQKKLYPKTCNTDFNQANALKHATWNAVMTDTMGADRAEAFANAHEEFWILKYPKECEMDFHFNELGRKIALEYAGQGYDVFVQKIQEAIMEDREHVIKWDEGN